MTMRNYNFVEACGSCPVSGCCFFFMFMQENIVLFILTNGNKVEFLKCYDQETEVG